MNNIKMDKSIDYLGHKLAVKAHKCPVFLLLHSTSTQLCL